MKADTLVYESNGDETRLAALDGGRMTEVDIYNENHAGEGNQFFTAWPDPRKISATALLTARIGTFPLSVRKWSYSLRR